MQNNDFRKPIVTQRFGAPKASSTKSSISKTISDIKIKFPKFDKPMVSILLVARDNYKYIKSCLHYILKNTQEISYEIILVDDNSADATKNIAEELENVRLIKNTSCQGEVKSINFASKYANGRYICVLSSYTIPKEHWLEYLVFAIQKEKNVGITCSKIISKEGLIIQPGFFIDAKANYKNIDEDGKSDSPNLNKLGEVDCASTSSMLIAKKAWDKVGGFNEEYTTENYAVADLSFKLKYNEGAKIIYHNKSEVVCFNKENSNDECLADDHIRFYYRWNNELNAKFCKANKKGIDIHVCFGLTDNYSQHTGCVIASILLNSSLNDKYHFYLLSEGISPKNREYFERLKKIKDFEISYIRLAEEDFKDVQLNSWNKSIYYRFKVFDLINADKVLYLDSDLIVRKDLRNLYETDISNYMGAAVKDILSAQGKKIYNLKKNATYVNSGVILFNLKKGREEKIIDKLFDCAQNYQGELSFPDQDVINIVLQTKIKLLNIKWNCMSPGPYCYDPEEYERAAQDPFIFHYISSEKPWIVGAEPYLKKEYFYYLRFTPWYKEFIEAYNKNKNLVK